jgi:hypothetical protein
MTLDRRTGLALALFGLLLLALFVVQHGGGKRRSSRSAGRPFVEQQHLLEASAVQLQVRFYLYSLPRWTDEFRRFSDCEILYEFETEVRCERVLSSAKHKAPVCRL